MKSKKKLLLMGVGVMGALAMGVGATSTFAWYQATTAGAVKNSQASDNIATAAPSAGAVDLPLAVTVDPSSDVSLEMVTYKSAWPSNLTATGSTEKATRLEADAEDPGAGWYHAYYDSAQSKDLYQAAALTNKPTFQVITITIKAPENTLGGDTYAYQDENGKTWTKNDIADALNTKTAQINVERVTPGGKTNRAVFYGAGTSSPSNPTNNTGHNTSGTYEVEDSFALDASTLKGDGHKFYFGMYVEGEKGSAGYDADTSIVADFRVTVSKTA